jgi:hypothetical protein
MSEPQQQPSRGKQDRLHYFFLGLLCLMFFFDGLERVVTAGESGSTLKMVLGVAGMVLGGTGAAYAVWLIFLKRA